MILKTRATDHIWPCQQPGELKPVWKKDCSLAHLSHDLPHWRWNIEYCIILGHKHYAKYCIFILLSCSLFFLGTIFLCWMVSLFSGQAIILRHSAAQQMLKYSQEISAFTHPVIIFVTISSERTKQCAAEVLPDSIALVPFMCKMWAMCLQVRFGCWVWQWFKD